MVTIMVPSLPIVRIKNAIYVNFLALRPELKWHTRNMPTPLTGKFCPRKAEITFSLSQFKNLLLRQLTYHRILVANSLPIVALIPLLEAGTLRYQCNAPWFVVSLDP